MDKLINGRDSVVSSAPELLSHLPNFATSSRIPKPFDKLSHITGKIHNASSNESGTVDTSSNVSPLNRAYVDSPNSFIGKIPKSNLLEGCCAFIDIWSREGDDNRSMVFARILSRMGATTLVRKFTKKDDVTHVVFHHGHKSSLQKAKSRGIKVVSCLWVDRCRTTQTWVDEQEFLFDDTNYKPPKKFREMQPLDPEEELARSAERARRRQARDKRNDARRAVTFLSPLATGAAKCAGDCLRKQALASDTPFHSSTYKFSHPRLVSETPSASIQRKLQRMREGKPIFSPPSSPISDSDCSQKSSSQRSAENDHPSTDNAAAANIIISSQKLSDMDLTCTDLQHTDFRVPAADEKEKEESFNREKGSFNSIDSDDAPTIRLRLSDSSKSCLEDSEQSSSLLPPGTNMSHTRAPTTIVSESPLSITDEVEEHLPPKNKSSKARRKLCQEVVQPASFLISPKVQDTNRRKSRRVSSINASIAISSTYSRQTVKVNTENISINTDRSSVSTLPPPGRSAMKTATARRRFFDPVINSPSDCYESSDSRSDEENRPKSGYRSFSTAYEDNDKKEEAPRKSQKQKITSDLSILMDLSSNLQNEYLRKRTRQSTSSSSSENTKRSTIKPSKKLAKRQSNLFNKSNKVETNSAIIKEITEPSKPRRSTEEFLSAPLLPTTQSQHGKPKKRARQSTSVIVMTSLHTNERSALENIVRELGSFRIHSRVKDDRTSHVICGAARRTLNVLHAISRGLWLLSKDWLLESKRAGHWLNEEDFEVDFFPSAKQARLLRSHEPSWRLPLFRPMKGKVYVSPDTEPPTDELKELVTLCGGRVIGSPRHALVRVGLYVTLHDSLPAVKETWILGMFILVNMRHDEERRSVPRLFRPFWLGDQAPSRKETITK